MDLQAHVIYSIALSYTEYMYYTFRIKFNSLRIIVIYRPTKADFINNKNYELYDLINNILHQNASKVMIVGDFNYIFDYSSFRH